MEVEVNELWYDVDEGSVDLHASRMHVIIRKHGPSESNGAMEVQLSRVAMHPVQQLKSQSRSWLM